MMTVIDMPQMRGQIFETPEIMSRHEIVDVLERRLHPARQRLISCRTKQRIQPDQPRAAASKPRELPGEELRISAVPPIGHNQDDRTMAHDTACPRRVERAQRLTDTCAATPVLKVADHARNDMVTGRRGDEA